MTEKLYSQFTRDMASHAIEKVMAEKGVDLTRAMQIIANRTRDSFNYVKSCYNNNSRANLDKIALYIDAKLIDLEFMKDYFLEPGDFSAKEKTSMLEYFLEHRPKYRKEEEFEEKAPPKVSFTRDRMMNFGETNIERLRVYALLAQIIASAFRDHGVWRSGVLSPVSMAFPKVSGRTTVDTWVAKIALEITASLQFEGRALLAVSNPNDQRITVTCHVDPRTVFTLLVTRIHAMVDYKRNGTDFLHAVEVDPLVLQSYRKKLGGITIFPDKQDDAFTSFYEKAPKEEVHKALHDAFEEERLSEMKKHLTWIHRRLSESQLTVVFHEERGVYALMDVNQSQEITDIGFKDLVPQNDFDDFYCSWLTWSEEQRHGFLIEVKGFSKFVVPA